MTGPMKNLSMNRSANRPGSQHMARFRNFGLVATV
jgi:hypothetical protein